MTALLLILKAVPLRVWAVVAAVLALLTLYGWQRHEISTLRSELGKAQAVLDKLKAASEAQVARVEVAERRMADVDLRTKWLLKEFGEQLPRTEEEARVWALRAAKEIGQ